MRCRILGVTLPTFHAIERVLLDGRVEFVPWSTMERELPSEGPLEFEHQIYVAINEYVMAHRQDLWPE